MSKSIHISEVKPFAIGPLAGRLEHHEGLACLKEGCLYNFTISTLSDSLTESLPKLINIIKSAPVELGTACLAVENSRIYFRQGLTYFRLMSEAAVREKLKLKFISPTCFRHDGKLLLLPHPKMIFLGLARRWRHFSDIPLPVYNIEHLQVSRYKLKTEAVLFKSYSLAGFMGSCEYSFPDELEEIELWPFFTLLKFASIAGLGYKTTMGLGQVRVF